MSKEHYFSVDNRDEAERLRAQQDLMMKFDFPVYEKHLAGRKNLNILDIGCNTGRYAMMRLERFPGIIGNYVGVEYDMATVESARGTYGSDKVSFHCLDISKDDFCDSVRKIMAERGIADFDLIIVSFVMQHLKDRDGAARKMRSLSSAGTLLLLADIDDGMNAMDPDPEGYAPRLRNIIDRLGFGFRHFGRTAPEVFRRAGFGEISLEQRCITTIGMTAEERRNLFALYEHIPAMVAAKDDGSFEDDKRWIAENLDKYREIVLDPGTLVSLGFLIFSIKA